MSAPPNHLERIHLLVDGELNADDAEQVRSHLVDCAECQSELDAVLQLDALTQTMYAAPKSAPVPEPIPTTPIAAIHHLAAARERKSPSKFRWVAAASGIAAAALVLLIVRPGNDVDPYRLGETRPIEARLSHPGASEYRRYDVARSGEMHGVQVPLETLARLEKKGDADGVATGLLLRGEKAQAKETLARAASTPAVESDKAVAALLTGDDEGALDLLEKVLRADPGNALALWNRGLALRDLGLPMAAAEAFDQVAAKNEPGWSDEAKQRAAALRKGLNDRHAAWKAADDAGKALVNKRALPSDAMVRAQPGLFRLYFYDVLRTSTDAASANALKPLADQLDALSGGAGLAGWVDRVAHSNFAVRAPLAAAYLKSFNSALDPAGTAEMLAASEKANQPDLRMGILLRAGALRAHLDEYKKLADTAGDAWFQAIAAQEEGASFTATDPLRSERLLRAGIEKAQAAHLDYRVALLQLKLSELLANTFHRIPEAFVAAQSASRSLSASGNAIWEQVALNYMANATRLRWSLVLASAYLHEALLRHPDDCGTQTYVHQILAGIALIDLRPADARREFEAGSGCSPPDLQTVFTFAEIARSTDKRPTDSAQLDAMVGVLRKSESMSAGERLILGQIQGRAMLEAHAPGAKGYLERVITDADALAANDVMAQKARAYSYAALDVDMAASGRFDELFSSFEKELGSTASTCTIGVGAEDESAFSVVKGAHGEVIGDFQAVRTERIDRFSPRPTPAQLAALRNCSEVSVLARPPLQGRPGVLPADMAWSYGAPKPAPPQSAGRAKRLVVADAEPPAALGLPRLGSWKPSNSTGVLELRGAQATPARVLAEMETATEIEIDAHGLVDSAVSDASLIALTQESDGQWALSAGEVRAHRLLGKPLVILAACRAAVGASAVHAAWSLPAAFLQAGARAVFASGDEIPDAQASEFFDAVKAGINAGKSNRIALRDTRLAFLARPDGAWADSVLLFE